MLNKKVFNGKISTLYKGYWGGQGYRVEVKTPDSIL